MWYNDLSPDQHQIIHTHPSPLPPRLCAFGSASTKPGPNLPAPVKEDPNEIAFLHAHNATGYVASVVEHKWNCYLAFLDSFLDLDEFLP